MKKNLIYLLSALSLVAVASCTKELADPENAVSSAKETQLTFTLSPDTKTSLSEGKTCWAAGDKILVTDGTTNETLEVPTSAAGASTVTLGTTLSATKLYAVYPATAFGSIADGKVNVKIPTDQSGDFAEANISAAVTTTAAFNMKNTTAVMKVSTTGDGLYVVFNAIGTAISGTMAVEFNEDGTVKSTSVSGSTGVITMEAPTTDDYYVAVAPGTYASGFSVMAIDPASGTFESKKTTVSNTVSVNGMVDLGSLGDNLSGFDGTGTEADPYKLSSLGEMIAFANCVNAGKDFKGEYVKLMSNVSGLTTTIGCYDVAAKTDRYFKGNFNGNGKTVTVNLDGATCKSPNYVALFGEAGEGANIHDVTVAGTVTTTGFCSAGLVGCINAAGGAKVTNCTNKANVSGSYELGGIVGYVDATYSSSAYNMIFDNCTNYGKITGTGNQNGGIAGYAKYVEFDNCTNNGAVSGTTYVGGIVGNASSLDKFVSPKNYGSITGTYGGLEIYHLISGSSSFQYSKLDGTSATTSSTNALIGVGGIAGYANNVNISSAVNGGTIKGVCKVAGILGSMYGGNVSGCSNSGSVTASGNISAGIIAEIHVQGNCVNNTNSGTVTANSVAGGIIGICNALGYSSSDAVSGITSCKNTGSVNAKGSSTIYIYGGTYSGYSAAGGIVGMMADAAQSSSRRGRVTMTKCANEGPVTGAGSSVGGVIGLMDHYYLYSTSLMVNACSNKGKITGEKRVGGILGAGFNRYIAHSSISIRNAVNTGDIYATTTDNGSSCAGGIVGWNWYTSTSAAGVGYGIRVYNAQNNGNVSYANASMTDPYVGGIVGYSVVGVVQNSYNCGKIGPASGEALAAADTTRGACAGYMGNFMSGDWNYYLTGTAKNAYGTKTPKEYSYGDSSVATIIGEYSVSTDDGITLNSAVTCYDATDETDLVTALNAWVTKYSSLGYFSWEDGPAIKY